MSPGRSPRLSNLLPEMVAGGSDPGAPAFLPDGLRPDWLPEDSWARLRDLGKLQVGWGLRCVGLRGCACVWGGQGGAAMACGCLQIRAVPAAYTHIPRIIRQCSAVHVDP